MMKKSFVKIVLLMVFGLLLNTSIYSQFTFNYQGFLKVGNAPATGQHFFEFKLFDAPTGGNQLGTTTSTSSNLTNGHYSVNLNFGNQFTGLIRYLEISVRDSSTQQFTILTPRQPINRVPYATNADFLNGRSAAGYIINQTETQLNTNFAIDGTGFANLFNSGTQYNIGGSRVLSAPASQNLFVGFNAGQNNSGGFSNTFVGSGAGSQNQSGDENSFFGMNSGSQTTGNLNTFIGRNAGITNGAGSSNTVLGGNANVGSANLTNATAIGAGTIATNSDTIQLGRDTIDSVRIGRLGSNGTTAVCLNSVNGFATCSSSLRYKSNVNDYSSGLSLIRKLRPVSFNWKDGGWFDFGLVAEEVFEIEPLLVTQNDKGEIEGVKYDRLGVVMINVVQEQQKQIDEQARIIKRQQKDFDDLKSLVCSIKPKVELCRQK